MGPHAIDLLTEDHATLRETLRMLTESDDPDDRRVRLAEADRHIKVHGHVAAEIFYPAFRQAVGKGEPDVLHSEILEEHRLVEKLLDEFQELDPASDEYHAKTIVLRELLEQHMDQEEEDVFPQARAAIPAEELESLGQRIQAERVDYEPPTALGR